MLIVVGVVALYSIVLLLRMCDITGHRSYEEIAFAAFGKSGMNFVIFCITLREVYKHCQLRSRFLQDLVTVVTKIMDHNVETKNDQFNPCAKSDQLIVHFNVAKNG